MSSELTSEDIELVAKAELRKMVLEDQEPVVTGGKEVNNGFRWHFAERVYEALSEPSAVEIVGIGTMNTLHRWLKYDGIHYDAEAPSGRENWRELPFWKRNNAPTDGYTPDSVGKLT